MQSSFIELCNDPSVKHIGMSLSYDGELLTKETGSLGYSKLIYSTSSTTTRLTFSIEDFDDLFEICQLVLERVYMEFLISDCSFLHVLVFPERNVSLRLSIDRRNLVWTINAPYNTWIEITEFLESTCPGSRASFVNVSYPRNEVY